MTTPCKFEEKIITLCEDESAIKTNTERISRYETVIFATASAVVVQIIIFAVLFGRIQQGNEQNERGIIRLESMVFAAQTPDVKK